MQYSKELPQIPSEGKWWGSVEKPSKRLIVEHLAMATLFDLRGQVQLDLPKSSWDVEKIIISTNYFKLRQLKDPNYDLGFLTSFSMDDGGKLCKPNEKWNMWFFLPVAYPLCQPSVVLFTEERWITDPHHILRSIFVEGKEYPAVSCHCPPGFHNSGFTTCLHHAQQAICYLRSNLDSKKNGGKMKFYG